MEDAVILVCALADDAQCVPDSVFTHSCARCSRGLMVAPSGQRILRKYPQATTVCGACFHRLPGSADYRLELAAGAAEIRDEMRRAQSNAYRRRN